MDKKIQEAIELLTQHGYEVLPPQAQEPQEKEDILKDFVVWWNLYNKKRGKDKCLKKWMRMSKKDRQACLAATPAYVQTITAKQYQKDPFTYMNGRCWEDEIIDPYGDIQQQQQQQQMQTAIGFATKAAAIISAD